MSNKTQQPNSESKIIELDTVLEDEYERNAGNTYIQYC